MSEPIVNKILQCSGIKSPSNKSDICRACALGKSHRLPLVSKHVSSCEPFDFGYMDVWGPSPKLEMNSECYFY